MKNARILAVLFLCALTVPCFAQIQDSSRQTKNPRATNQENSSEKSRNDSETVVFQKRGALPFKKRISREQKKLLTPDAADLTRYSLFLNQPKTGLIKLLPDLGCEENARIIRADEICLSSVPMSAFYSFREREHTSDFLSDIRLKNDMLITDGFLVQGLMVALGDIALETATLETAGMKFINNFVPETQGVKALEQTKKLAKGIRTDNFLYKKALPVNKNTTYALRTVAYRGNLLQSVNGRPFDMLAGDERIDITVVFKVLKRDETGNLTLLWKELARKDAPKVVFPKRDKR